ncbi:hypothetical protein ACFQFC_29975 [Amorphoplanes digitatis]|uniref:Flavin reductase n=1 Tax=Actinoplanes digitatis TaxID=1868 RepID=A0A7W7HT91_9ACTN|nr:hypothetical protein [Actinoplanes digitatis]MBB4760377.1 hypothetical protein [Actinoplanes digitatis]BFE68501.1 hypothetical protein GCM10020092_018020 [Actinoplanes digitatis]GID98539.1 hypothetical protein Adi01nite_79510 [Actinoplanes digitatis]
MSAQERAEHLGARPTWDCLACGRPWPCAYAKDELLAEFHRHPSSLTIYMSSYMCEAMNDLVTQDVAPPPDLYERFLSWVRPSLTGLPIRKPLEDQ